MAGKLLKDTKDKKKLNKNSNVQDSDVSDNIYKIETDDNEVDEIFGNVNKWLKDAEEEVAEKKSRRRLTKVEEGIKSSKTKTNKKSRDNEISNIDEISEIEDNDEPVRVIPKKRTRKDSTQTVKKAKTTRKKTTKTEIAETDSGTEIELEEKINLEGLNRIEEEENKPNEIKMHTENNMTEIFLKKNTYKIELQKTEYNIYTNTNETSYLIVRDQMLRMTTKEGFLLLEKQGDTYEITTNQDFKINYVIDNLERKNSEVNFELTNLTEIYAYEDGLVFEIDEEKVIENNLEDNKTLVISEEDGKVYLPYSKDDIKNEVMQNKGSKISEVIEEKYVLPLDKYKNSMRARFREGYNLMYRKEGKSKKSAILLGIELMFETNLHPAIISACKNLEELDIYLDCLEDNELEKFSCFKIIYKSLPTLRKKAKFQEF